MLILSFNNKSIPTFKPSAGIRLVLAVCWTDCMDFDFHVSHKWRYGISFQVIGNSAGFLPKQEGCCEVRTLVQLAQWMRKPVSWILVNQNAPVVWVPQCDRSRSEYYPKLFGITVAVISSHCHMDLPKHGEYKATLIVEIECE